MIVTERYLPIDCGEAGCRESFWNPQDCVMHYSSNHQQAMNNVGCALKECSYSFPNRPLTNFHEFMHIDPEGNMIYPRNDEEYAEMAERVRLAPAEEPSDDEPNDDEPDDDYYE